MLLAPGSMAADESEERVFIDVRPLPFSLKGRDRLRRARHDRGGIIAGCSRRSKPVPCDDAEVAGAATGMRPPEVAIRIRGLPGRDHAARLSVLVDGDHFDGGKVIRGEAELTAQKPEGATGHM